MPNQNKYPFLRILLPMMAGIIIGFYAPFAYSGLNLLLLAVFIILCTILYLFLRSYSLRWVFGMSLSLFMVFAGISRVQTVNQQHRDNILKADSSFRGVYIGRLTEPPRVKEQSIRLMAELRTISSEGFVSSQKETVIVYLRNEDDLPSLNYGSLIGFSKLPEYVESPLNPEQFDYQDYLAKRGIFRQVFLKQNEWNIIPGMQTNLLFEWAFECREYLMKVLKNNGLSGDEYTVATAILLGYDEELPQYLRKGYVASGAMHILSVSGLHVGIIYLIFNFLFGLFLVGKTKEKIRLLLLLVLVWFYAFLTGLSPSVLRSAIMISFILVGNMLHRKGNLINSLAASAFVLILADPANLLNVGFQLSYSAVLGIALFQEPFSKMLYFNNRILRWTWDSISVTIAAQLTTLPLILFYFHQFPLYFIPANLLLIPLSFVILVCGMALLILFFIPVLSFWIGKLLSLFIFIMNYSVSGIEKLPYSVLDGLYIGITDSILLTVLVFMLWVFLKYNTRKVLIPAMTVLVLFVFMITMRNLENRSDTQIVVYGINRHTAIDLIAGKSHRVLADTALKADEYAIDYNLKAYWARKGLKPDVEFLPLFEKSEQHNLFIQKNDLVSFSGKLFSVWNGKTKQRGKSIHQQAIDFVIITGNSKPTLSALQNLYLVKQMIIDLSVPSWRAEEWERLATEAGIQVFSIRKKGSWILNLDSD
jgi:competence protein ComEC